MTAEITGQELPTSGLSAAGTVVFVGIGPGDPDLITVRAVEMIQAADAIMLERPGQRAMLRHASDDVEVVDLSDGELDADGRLGLVAAACRPGRTVVRLLDGDPLLDSSGASEADSCVRAGLTVELVPGIPLATGVPAYAGVPLSSNGDGRQVRVVDVTADGDVLAQTSATDTLVLLGGPDGLGRAAGALVEAGHSADTPVAVTSAGCTVGQRTVVTTLSRIEKDLARADLSTPVVTVIGEAVRRRETLSWFETKPLFGWRVLVPRTKEQAPLLSERIRRYGGVPHEVPTISVEPPRNPNQVEKAVRGLVEGRYEWIAFTSVNALRAIREKFGEFGLDSRAVSGLKVAAVGQTTAAALREWGIVPDLVPSGEQSSAGLLAEWPEYDESLDPINRVFLPRADIATETLAAGLSDLGWEVDDVTAYRTVRAAPPPAETREAIKTGKYDAVVFTSSSTVRNLVGIAGKPHAVSIICCIGPQTAKTAKEHGLRVDVMAPEPSMESLSESLAAFGATRRAEMIQAGDVVVRPSERRRARAKKPSSPDRTQQ